MQTVLGGFQRARKGATKIWRKLPRNGSALMRPMVVFGSSKALATSAVMKTFTGSDIVTIGIATMPSVVQSRSARSKSALRAGAVERGTVAFTVRWCGMGAMRATVAPEIFQQKKAVAIARALIGKHLVRRFRDGRIEARMITETEAYVGERDLACHARAGRTARTEVMYRAGGIWYVYLCYGIHEMLNLVVGPADWPAAVLIRGVEGASGPGRVTKLFGIGRKLNGRSAGDVTGELWIEDRGARVPRGKIIATPRIGIDYAGPVWTAKKWRFVWHGRPARGVAWASRPSLRRGAPSTGGTPVPLKPAPARPRR